MWILSATDSLSFVKFSAAALHIPVYISETKTMFMQLSMGTPIPPNLGISTAPIEEQTFKL